MKEKKVILTGDRPTGPLHLGHYIGSLANRVKLQHEYTQFVMLADMQALTDHADDPKLIKESVLQVAIDYLSVGIDPQTSTILVQSRIPALSELTMYYLNLVTWNRLKHNPTVKAEITQKNYRESVPAGFMVYPVSQAADITAFKADIVPVGADQLPMIEQTQEIVRKFNKLYNTHVLVEPSALIPTNGARLVGTDGNAKMSKSLKNAIYLSDSEDIVQKKIKSMYTDPNHLRVEDPGQVENNPVFIYLDLFGRDRAKIEEYKEHYKRGGLGDMVVKKYLIEVIQEFLNPIRARRRELEKDLPYVMKVLQEGSDAANEIANKTLKEVKAAIGFF